MSEVTPDQIADLLAHCEYLRDTGGSGRTDARETQDQRVAAAGLALIAAHNALKAEVAELRGPLAVTLPAIGLGQEVVIANLGEQPITIEP
jgi:hypothetical protein